VHNIDDLETGVAPRDVPLCDPGGSYTELSGYLIGRYYDPATGQFISVDPLVDLTEAPFSYVDGDPVSETDPTGLCCGLLRRITESAGHEFVVNAPAIAAASAFVAVLPIPGVDVVAAVVSVAAGGVATYSDASTGHWTAAGLDAAGAGLGGASLYDAFVSQRLLAAASRAWRLGPIADWLRADAAAASGQSTRLGRAGFAASILPFGLSALLGSGSKESQAFGLWCQT